MQFDNDKKVFLAKTDKSKIGCIDRDILNLVNLINSKKDYYTTSSCSGRIVLFKQSKKFKPGSSWLFVKHSTVGMKEFSAALAKAKGIVWLMAEPVILHVNCRSVEDAKTLLAAVRNAGLKHSGIISMTKKIMLEIVGNESMDVPVVKDIDANYLKILVSEANKKIRKTKKNIQRLEKFIASLSWTG